MFTRCQGSVATRATILSLVCTLFSIIPAKSILAAPAHANTKPPAILTKLVQLTKTAKAFEYHATVTCADIGSPDSVGGLHVFGESDHSLRRRERGDFPSVINNLSALSSAQFEAVNRHFADLVLPADVDHTYLRAINTSLKGPKIRSMKMNDFGWKILRNGAFPKGERSEGTCQRLPQGLDWGGAERR